MNNDAFEAAGLYDPSAEGAGERLALLSYLDGRGVTLEEMVEAESEGRLIGLAVDTVIRPPGERLTFAELQRDVGIEPELLSELHRALGFPMPGPDDRAYTPADVRCFQVLGGMVGLFGRGSAMEITRACGSAMAKVANAAMTAISTGLERPMILSGVGEFSQTQVFIGIVEALPLLFDVMETVNRRHLLNGRRAEVFWDVAGRPSVDMTVGFADLVGYTLRVGGLDSAAVTEVVEAFEAEAISVVGDFGGRVVKFIGDEVMFTAPKADAACAIAIGLVRSFRDDPALPELRVGLAAGPVVPYEGDYYGNVVNIAARLVKQAEVGAVLVSSTLADRAGDAYQLVPVGRLPLKGVGPTEAFVLAGEQGP